MTPNNLDDLLVILPGLRNLRSMDAGLLRILLNRQKGSCTWCGEKIGKGRQTWCSDECVKSFKLRCCSNTTREFVTKRDQGICRKCGRNTIEAEREALRIGLQSWPFKRQGETAEEFEIRKEENIKRLRDEFGFARGRWREVDHDPPVIEGGGLCDPICLRLLCGSCHDEETSSLNRRRKTKS